MKKKAMSADESKLIKAVAKLNDAKVYLKDVKGELRDAKRDFLAAQRAKNKKMLSTLTK
jgi:hypothetical protein